MNKLFHKHKYEKKPIKAMPAGNVVYATKECKCGKKYRLVEVRWFSWEEVK